MNEKDIIHLLRQGAGKIDDGIEFGNELLADHDAKLGRTTRRNRVAAESMENDLAEMREAREQMLKASNDMEWPKKFYDSKGEHIATSHKE